jgi:hypothetical protein
MSYVDKDGRIHKPNRNWYTKRETDEIYANGGRVLLKLKEATPFQKQRAARKASKVNAP